MDSPPPQYGSYSSNDADHDVYTPSGYILPPPPPPLPLPPVRVFFGDRYSNPYPDAGVHHVMSGEAAYSHNQDNQQAGGMSLNVHLTVPAPVSGVPGGAVGQQQDGSHTPNTPEILNSIVNMQNGPFSGYTTAATQQQQATSTATTNTIQPPMAMESPMSEDSPMMDVSTPTTSPTSVQHYRSQFIKEGLKMKVKQKLVASKSKKDTSGGGGGGPSSSKKANNNTPAAIPTFSIEDVDSNSSSEHGFVQSKALIKKEELTEEDEMRRQRRRERNKVAATKCRNKKKLRTQMLMKESEILENQNKNLKSEITKLEVEKKRLMEVLSAHEPNCVKRFLETTRGGQQQQQEEMGVSESSSSNVEFRIPRPTSPPTLSSVQSQYQIPGGGFNNYNDRLQGPATATSSEVKMEDDLTTSDSYLRSSCSFATSASPSQPQQGPFLVKRPFNNTYLDMDSRCIAL